MRATAVDACQHGFVPLVVREAVGDRHPAPHEANLFDLQAKYAEVISLAAPRSISRTSRDADQSAKSTVRRAVRGSTGWKWMSATGAASPGSCDS